MKTGFEMLIYVPRYSHLRFLQQTKTLSSRFGFRAVLFIQLKHKKTKWKYSPNMVRTPENLSVISVYLYYYTLFVQDIVNERVGYNQ